MVREEAVEEDVGAVAVEVVEGEDLAVVKKEQAKVKQGKDQGRGSEGKVDLTVSARGNLSAGVAVTKRKHLIVHDINQPLARCFNVLNISTSNPEYIRG